VAERFVQQQQHTSQINIPPTSDFVILYDFAQNVRQCADVVIQTLQPKLPIRMHKVNPDNLPAQRNNYVILFFERYLSPKPEGLHDWNDLNSYINSRIDTILVFIKARPDIEPSIQLPTNFRSGISNSTNFHQFFLTLLVNMNHEVFQCEINARQLQTFISLLKNFKGGNIDFKTTESRCNIL